MHQIDHNFSTLKKGETICYHIGNLAADKFQRKFSAHSGFTEDALILQNVSDDLYRRSCASWNCGTGEFELKQKKLGFNKYAYLAKKIK